MCTHVYDNACECPQCMVGKTVIDYTCVPDTSFNLVRDPIVGDLKKYGWVVMCGLTIDSDTATEINNMPMKGAGVKGAWKSIEISEQNIK